MIRALLRRVRSRFPSETKQHRKQQRKEERRRRFFGQEWRHGDAFSARNYADYEAYLAHQSDKLGRIEDRLRRQGEQALDLFKARFRTCPALSDKRVVICLGARLGTEVRALVELGHFAVGIDLNPGQGNQWVLTGDFHRLAFADGTVDAVYTNALDHAFDLERMSREAHRVLRAGGVWVADIVVGYEEGFIAGEFEATHWARARDLADELARLGPFEIATWRSLAELGEPSWNQAVLRKAE